MQSSKHYGSTPETSTGCQDPGEWRVIAVLRRNEGINQTAMADLMDVEPITLRRNAEEAAELPEKMHMERVAGGQNG